MMANVQGHPMHSFMHTQYDAPTVHSFPGSRQSRKVSLPVILITTTQWTKKPLPTANDALTRYHDMETIGLSEFIANELAQKYHVVAPTVTVKSVQIPMSEQQQLGCRQWWVELNPRYHLHEHIYWIATICLQRGYNILVHSLMIFNIEYTAWSLDGQPPVTPALLEEYWYRWAAVGYPPHQLEDDLPMSSPHGRICPHGSCTPCGLQNHYRLHEYWVRHPAAWVTQQVRDFIRELQTRGCIEKSPDTLMYTLAEMRYEEEVTASRIAALTLEATEAMKRGISTSAILTEVDERFQDELDDSERSELKQRIKRKADDIEMQYINSDEDDLSSNARKYRACIASFDSGGDNQSWSPIPFAVL